MKKHLFTLFILSISSVSFDTESANVRFHKRIDESCGIEVIKDHGEISFGHRYGQDALSLKLLANQRDKRLVFRLSYINVEMGSETISDDKIHFKVETPERFVGNVDYWRNGIEINQEQLDSSKLIRISARVDLNEYQMPAGEVTLNMEWYLDCY